MRKLCILVIADQAMNAELFRALLGSQGHELTFTRNHLRPPVTCEALGRPFDLILMDVTMTFMDGLGLAAEVRTKPALKDTPLLFVTGSASIVSRKGPLEIVGVGVLEKPHRRREFLEAITAFMIEKGVLAPDESLLNPVTKADDRP